MIPEKELSHAERQVMAAVWALPAPVSRTDISRRLTQQGWKPTTQLAFLHRLEEKGYLRAEKQAGRNLYTPLVRRKEYGAAQTQELIDQLFGGSLADMVEALADTGRASTGRLEKLRARLEEVIAERVRYEDLYDPYG